MHACRLSARDGLVSAKGMSKFPQRARACVSSWTMTGVLGLDGRNPVVDTA